MKVTIVETQTANLASVVAAFERVGAHIATTRDPHVVREASRVVLPGVGTFAAGMASLETAGLVDAIRERTAEERSVFGICLGLQLLATGSAESPDVAGLGIISAPVAGLHPSKPVPQMGWNRVSANGGLISEGWAYFANSFAFEDVPEGWSPSWARHGERDFVAAVERRSLLACQFHPELSGDFGMTLIERWFKEAAC